MVRLRVVAVALIRNEADILPAWLAHLATWATDAILMDHGSTDGSRALLEAACTAHRWTLWSVDVCGYHQEAFTNFAIHHAFAAGADWVVPLDADEFADDTLPVVLSRTEGAAQLRWRACVPDDEWGHWWRAPTAGPLNKLAISRAAWASHDVQLGNHRLVDGEGREITATVVGEICHFPLRSVEQARRKIVMGAIGLLGRGDGDHDDNPWRLGLSLVAAGLTDADVRSWGSRYPFMRGPELRCTASLRSAGWRRFSGPALVPLDPIDPWKAVAARLAAFTTKLIGPLVLDGATLREAA